ncbi:MAG: cupredoxin domain-containing protein [Alphaproteobacteria bacterium]
MSFASILSLTIAASPSLAAGSNEGGHGDGMDHQMMHPEIGEPGDPATATETIEVVMNDNYFEPESITVPAGATVRFVVKNEGGLLHEFNIGTAAMHAEMQPEMAMMMEHGMLTETGMMRDMANMDHSAMSGMDMDEMMASLEGHPNRVLVEPGETKELTWTFSQDTELEFACNLPGRYDSGMMGNLKIED